MLPVKADDSYRMGSRVIGDISFFISETTVAVFLRDTGKDLEDISRERGHGDSHPRREGGQHRYR
jgi:anti-sigma regulatory factor (Ser/Thr protein kinase)